MTQKHKRPTAPASKKLPKKAAAKPAATAASKATHAAANAKAKHVEKHAEVKKPVGKVKAPEKNAAPAPEAKGKVVELKPAQKLAAARAAAQAAGAAAAAPVPGKKGKKGNAELINLPARRNVMPEERQSQLKLLIALRQGTGLPDVFAGERSPAVARSSIPSRSKTSST